MTSAIDKDIRDLPGNELLSYIQEEKRQLEKSGLLKKQKPFPPIPDELKPFQLPDNWKWVRLGDISRKIHYGYTASATYNDTGVKMLRITDIQDNKVDWGKVPYCEIDNEKLEATRLYPKDILFARTGGTVGKSFLVEQVEGVSVFASYLIRVQLMEPMNAEFIKFFFESPLYWKQIIDAVTGTGQPNVNATSLSQLMVPIPSLTEQAEIVTKFKNGTMLTENIRVKVAHEKKELVRYRQAILQEAMQGKLVKQNLEEGTGHELLASLQLEEQKGGKKTYQLSSVEKEREPHKVPTNWAWTRLGNIVTLLNGRAYKKPELLEEGKYPVLRVGNFFTNPSWYYSNLELEDNKYCDSGDLLYAWSASFGPKIWENGKVIYHYHIWRVDHSSFLYKKFLYYMLLHDVNTIKDDTTGSTMIHISKERMEKRLFALPPFAEQQRIVEKLDAIMMLCDRLEEELETTKAEAENWYRAVLQEVFQPEVE